MTERLFETTKTREEELYCVYCHRNKINGKRYIGQTVYQENPNNRFGSNGLGYRGCTYFYNAIQKYGWDAFDHYIIQDNLTKEEADELETLNIAFYNTTDPRYGYNLQSGGSHGVPNEQTHQKLVIAMNNPETKQKLIEKRKILFCGEGNPNFGKHWSDEAKQKISVGVSKAQKGLIWLHKDTVEVQVKPEQVNEYIANGYVKGRYFNKVWVQKDGTAKMVEQSDVQTYLNNGWLKGRPKVSKETRQKMSKSHKTEKGGY